MKNKLLSIAIASALATTLWSGNLLAEGNSIDVTQTNSEGSVTGAQQDFVMVPKLEANGTPTVGSDGKPVYEKKTLELTNNSKIKIIQEGADTGSSVSVTQGGATAADAEVQQYKATNNSAVIINQSGGSTGNGNTAKVIQGTMGVAGTNDNNTLTINTQAGSGNKIIGYAPTVTTDATATTPKTVVSGENGGYATQAGAGNIATLNQDGTTNIMGFNQDGAGNEATMTQDTASANSKMNVSQNGKDNKVTAKQEGTQGSDMNIKISGGSKTDLATDPATIYEGNEVTATQSSNDSTMVVSVNGSDNTATLEQGANADNSNMLLTQNGDLNEATMTQLGADNDMSLDQQNNNNKATLTQNGSGDTMAVSQSGNSTVTMTQ